MTKSQVSVRKTCKHSCSNNNHQKLLSSYAHAIIHANPFCVQLCYFVILSLLGFVALKSFNFKTSSARPRDIDLLFTAISAVTVSSMSTLDMEVFSNNQLIILMFLMFMGGEVFISMLGLQLQKFKYRLINSSCSQNLDSTVSPFDCIELAVDSNDLINYLPTKSFDQNNLMHEAIRSLGYVVLCYIIVVHFIGFIFVYIYITYTPSARSILMNKGFYRHNFSLFITISTFANCGFIPTNENMTIFKKNPGLQLILLPQIFLGNTLYPVVLRSLILVLEKITKRADLGYMLKHCKEMGYGLLLPMMETFYLAMTAIGLVLVHFVVFCCVEWKNQDAIGGLTGYEKVVASFFQVVNTRYAGEAVFDLSKLSPAILVGFIVMMYLPPLTTYFPVHDDEKSPRKYQRKGFLDYLLFSQLSYLVMFTILICFSERPNMDIDPLNFSVLNIVFEVFSAYGNVGLSTCYSCQRQIKPQGNCKEVWYGFAGRWSNTGKYLLILVMFIGRLKNFNKNGGKFWKIW